MIIWEDGVCSVAEVQAATQALEVSPGGVQVSGVQEGLASLPGILPIVGLEWKAAVYCSTV